MGLYTAEGCARAQAWMAAVIARVDAMTSQERQEEEQRLRDAVDQALPRERARAQYKLISFANLVRLADARSGRA